MKIRKAKGKEYKRAQRQNFRKGFNNTWVTKEVGKKLAAGVLDILAQQPRVGICHGVRNGTEMRMLQSRFPKAEIWGTDLDPNVLLQDIDNCICLDFHEALPNWERKFDFVYSNALGHSNNPRKALKVWFSTLRLGGVCVIQWAKGRERAPSDTHCVSASYSDMGALLEKYGEIAKTFKVKAGKMEFMVFVVKKIDE